MSIKNRSGISRCPRFSRRFSRFFAVCVASFLFVVAFYFPIRDALSADYEEVVKTLRCDMDKEIKDILDSTEAELVDDSNYYESIDVTKPFSILFYAENGKSSKGMVAIYSLIHNYYPHIKLYCYKLEYGDMAVEKKWSRIKRKYNLKTVPTLLVFNVVDGSVRGAVRVNGGENDIASLLNLYNSIIENKNFPEEMRGNETW